MSERRLADRFSLEENNVLFYRPGITDPHYLTTIVMFCIIDNCVAMIKCFRGMMGGKLRDWLGGIVDVFKNKQL